MLGDLSGRLPSENLRFDLKLGRKGSNVFVQSRSRIIRDKEAQSVSSQKYAPFMLFPVLLLICILLAQPSALAGVAKDKEPAKQATAVKEEKKEEKKDAKKEDAKEDEEEKEEEDPESEEIKAMEKELKQLKLEHDLLLQRQKNELVEQELLAQKLSAEAAVRKAKEEDTLADLRSQVSRLEAQLALQKATHEQELELMDAAVRKHNTQRQLEDFETVDQVTDLKNQISLLATETELRLEEVKKAKALTEEAGTKYAADIAKLKAELEILQARKDVSDHVTGEIKYLENPLVEGTLFVSDRRIPLNGPIYSGVADYVTERIHFFNNQSKKLPIFIMIAG